MKTLWAFGLLEAYNQTQNNGTRTTTKPKKQSEPELPQREDSATFKNIVVGAKPTQAVHSGPSEDCGLGQGHRPLQGKPSEQPLDPVAIERRQNPQHHQGEPDLQQDGAKPRGGRGESCQMTRSGGGGVQDH